jgi:Type VI secretion system effector, Hcp
MANPAYMTITGRIQGLISAGCSTEESIGSKYQSDHTDEIMVRSCTHNMANLDNNKTVTHSPIILSKYIDKASPLLAACVNLSKRWTPALSGLLRQAQSTLCSTRYSTDRANQKSHRLSRSPEAEKRSGYFQSQFGTSLAQSRRIPNESRLCYSHRHSEQDCQVR